MAVSIKDRALYEKLYDELKMNIAPPYTHEVQAILKDKGIQVSNEKIYNVVKGLTKDMAILFALRSVFDLKNPGDEEPVKSLVSRQRLNAPTTAKA